MSKIKKRLPDDGNGDEDAYNRGWNDALDLLKTSLAQNLRQLTYTGSDHGQAFIHYDTELDQLTIDATYSPDELAAELLK